MNNDINGTSWTNILPWTKVSDRVTYEKSFPSWNSYKYLRAYVTQNNTGTTPSYIYSELFFTVNINDCVVNNIDAASPAFGTGTWVLYPYLIFSSLQSNNILKYLVTGIGYSYQFIKIEAR